VLEKFIIFRRDVVVRRTRFDLARARERAHILEGLIIALNNIDANQSKLSRRSKTPAEASAQLCAKFKLSEIQAKAILEMRLQRLTGLERAKIDEEYSEVTKLIAHLQAILDDPQKVLQVIIDELNEIKEKYGDERRTEIVASSEDINIEDMIVEEDVVVTISHAGYIKRNAVSLYKSQHRGGRGVTGMATREEDFVQTILTTSTHAMLLFFTNKGKSYRLKGYQIPEAGRQAKGMAIVNLLALDSDEKIRAIIPIQSFDQGGCLMMATKSGIVKKTDLAEYSNMNRNGLIAINLREDDELIGVQLTESHNDIVLVTREGMSIRLMTKMSGRLAAIRKAYAASRSMMETKSLAWLRLCQANNPGCRRNVVLASVPS